MVVELFTSSLLFFFNDTATTEIYTLSLHDALPILKEFVVRVVFVPMVFPFDDAEADHGPIDLAKRLVIPLVRTGIGKSSLDRKSTRLNSSHLVISYAVFCLKKKKIDHGSYLTHTCG